MDYESLFKKYVSFTFIVAEGQTANIKEISKTVSDMPKEVVPAFSEEPYQAARWLASQPYFVGYAEDDILEECQRAVYFAEQDYVAFNREQMETKEPEDYSIY